MNLNRFALLLLAATYAARGQQPAEKHFVRASAEAVVIGTPDRAHISIGVRTQAATAKAAAEQNAIQTTAVLNTMKTVLGTKGQIQTSNYSISPHYENTNNSMHQDGFETDNSVEVTLDDLSLLPALLDTASSNGANSMSGIAFLMKDESALKLQALVEASRKAKTAAEAMAQALNLHVVAVANAESGVNSSPIRPLMMMAAPMGKAMATPIEAGSLEIHANVTVTLEVNP